MKTTIITAVAILIFTLGCYAGQSKTVYRVFKLTDHELAITCLNGGDPATMPKLTGEDALIVSCGE
jgi:hypothetical protein